MSDKSLKLLLRECIPILLVLSDPGRQVATFEEGGYIVKSEREKRREGGEGRRKGRRRKEKREEEK